MNETTIPVKGKLKITVCGPDGRVKDQREIDNLVVTAGKTFIASRMTSASDAVMSHMAVGTNNTSPVAGDTALNTETARVALTSATPSANSITYVGDYPPGTGTGTLVEAGLFNGAVTGTMLARTTFTAVAKGAGDTMSISWTVTVG